MPPYDVDHQRESRHSERYRDQRLLLTEIPLESPMPMPNIDTMSVRQLIDIVAFLDSKYQLMVEDYE